MCLGEPQVVSSRSIPDSARSSKSNPPTARSATARSECSAAPCDTMRSDTVRSTMNTTRAQTALAALAAERHALESRLAMIEAALEQETKKNVLKPRGKK